MIYDVAIIGAGPAGAALACALAGRWRVALVDREPAPRRRIGEAMVPAAGRTLRDLGLLPAFKALGFPPYVANRSQWGSEAIEYRDFVADADGVGWHLDRARFEMMLRREARALGATCLFGHRLEKITDEGLQLSNGDRIAASISVDATGRAAVLARQLGAQRIPEDDMAARWCFLRHPPGGQTGISSVIATRNGWWYHVAAPNNDVGQGTLAFHSSPEFLPKLGASDLLLEARQVPALAIHLEGATPISPATTTAAHTSRLDRTSGEDWIAIGDAGLCFDPIASRGLFHSLYTAHVAAALIDDHLSGIGEGFALYDEDLNRIHRTYQTHTRAVYRAEQRWPDAPFWRSRHRAV